MSTVLPRARYVRAILNLNTKLTTGLTTLGGVSLLGLGTLAHLPAHGHAEPATATAAPLPADSSVPVIAGDSQPLMAECAQALAESRRKLDRISAIEGTFEKRERLKGKLQPAEKIELKVRHEPLSVYMRWQQPDSGQEVLWQANALGGMIHVHPGGFRGRLMSMVKISPASAQVREGSRRPIDEIGLWEFNDRLIELVDDILDAPAGVQVKLDESAEIGGRPCLAYRFARTDSSSTDAPARLKIFIDRESKLAVACESHIRTTAGGEPVLDEYYAYYDLELGAALTSRDFDPANQAYGFGP